MFKKNIWHSANNFCSAKYFMQRMLLKKWAPCWDQHEETFQRREDFLRHWLFSFGVSRSTAPGRFCSLSMWEDSCRRRQRWSRSWPGWCWCSCSPPAISGSPLDQPSPNVCNLKLVRCLSSGLLVHLYLQRWISELFLMNSLLTKQEQRSIWRVCVRLVW